MVSAAVQLFEIIYAASNKELLEDLVRAVLDISSDPHDELKRLVDAM